jgi:hypothetical protein
MAKMPPVFREVLNDDAAVIDVSSGRASRRFRVTVAAVDAATAEADIDAMTPNIGDAHPAFPGLKFRSYEIRQVNIHRTAWEVTYNYEQQSFGTLDNDSPFDRDPDVSWFSRSENREFFRDVNNNAVINTAGEVFESLPFVLGVSTGLSYVRNERETGARWDLIMTWMAEERVGVNSDSFTVDSVGIPAQRAIMWIDRIDRIKEGDTVYRRTAYNFEFKRDRAVVGPVGTGTSITPAKAQHIVVANRGYNVKRSGDTTKRDALKLDDGTNTSVPQFLDDPGTGRSETMTNRVFQGYPLYPFGGFAFT